MFEDVLLNEMDRIMTNERVVIQKVKLPYPFFQPNCEGCTDQDQSYIEAWSPDSPGRLMIRLPSSSQKTPGAESIETLSVAESKLLLNYLGFCEENIPGWKPPNKKKNKKQKKHSVEHVSPKEWNEFQRWKETKDELSELADENLNILKEVLKYVEVRDDDIDELVEGLRRTPRLMRYVKTGHYPLEDIDDDDFSGFDESVLLRCNDNVYTPKQSQHEIMETKLIVEVHIEDISDGKL